MHLIPKICKVEGDASHGSDRVVAPLCGGNTLAPLAERSISKARLSVRMRTYLQTTR